MLHCFQGQRREATGKERNSGGKAKESRGTAKEKQRKRKGNAKDKQRERRGNAAETKKIGGFEDWRIQGLKDSKILATLGTLTFILFVLLLRAPAQTTCMYTLQEKEYQKLLCKGEVLVSV